MQVHDDFKSCVGYVVSKGGDGERLIGTAFGVGIPICDDINQYYLVTANHNLNAAYRDQDDVFVRANGLDGRADDYPVSRSDWVTDSYLDVAVWSLPNDVQGKLSLRHIPVKMFAKNVLTRKLPRTPVGLGDELCVISLFSQFPGKNNVEPVVRFGNVALIPENEIELDIAGSRFSVGALLIEARSFGGMSGAPVFLAVDTRTGLFAGENAPNSLLGFIHGHFDENTNVYLSGDGSPSGKARVNSGIAIVIPSDSIYEVLMGEELSEKRQATLAEHENTKPGAKSDSTT